nr:ABC transporter C-terminal domain-containing protein [Streptomyces sp. WM6386]
MTPGPPAERRVGPRDRRGRCEANLSNKETKLHAQIAENATDFAKVAELDATLRGLAGEREELEMRWLELAEDA